MDKVEYTEAERWLIEPKPGTAAGELETLGSIFRLQSAIYG